MRAMQLIDLVMLLNTVAKWRNDDAIDGVISVSILIGLLERNVSARFRFASQRLVNIRDCFVMSWVHIRCL